MFFTLGFSVPKQAKILGTASSTTCLGPHLPQASTLFSFNLSPRSNQSCAFSSDQCSWAPVGKSLSCADGILQICDIQPRHSPPSSMPVTFWLRCLYISTLSGISNIYSFLKPADRSFFTFLPNDITSKVSPQISHPFNLKLYLEPSYSSVFLVFLLTLPSS